MSLDTDIALLSRVKLFEGFDPDALRLLAFGAEARTYGAGTRLFRAGEASDSGYVIVDGRIELHPDGDETRAQSFTRAALIGEMALIVPTHRANTALVTEHTEVLKLPRPLFRRMLEEYPDLAALLQQRVAAEVGDFVKRLDVVRAKLDHATDITTRAS